MPCPAVAGTGSGAVEESESVKCLRKFFGQIVKQLSGIRKQFDDEGWVVVRGAIDERLLDIAEQFLGRNIALFASHYIAKPPRDGQPVLWHQDGSYWPLQPMEVVSMWLAADDSTPENGCMRVIPQTHRMDLQKLRK